MSNHRGAKLRLVQRVDRAGKTVSVAYADCGHMVVRMGHLAVGQRVFCTKHEPVEFPPDPTFASVFAGRP